MMAWIVLKRPQAESDLREISDYIAQNNPETAIRFLLKLNEQFKILAENPFLGRSREELLADLRGFPFGNYVVFYLPLDNGIEIVRILHGSRDISTFFKEES